MHLAGEPSINWFYKVHDEGLWLKPDLGGKLPEGMLRNILLQWYNMTKYKVHSGQHLPAQLLQMLPYIFRMWVWCLQSTV